MKSALRGRLFEQLGKNNQKQASSAHMMTGGSKENRLGFKIATSLIADLMTKCDMPYALSVFLPESGLKQEILTKREMLEVLNLNKDEYFKAVSSKDMTPLLLDIVEVIKANKSIRPNKVSTSIQTEDALD